MGTGKPGSGDLMRRATVWSPETGLGAHPDPPLAAVASPPQTPVGSTADGTWDWGESEQWTKPPQSQVPSADYPSQDPDWVLGAAHRAASVWILAGTMNTTGDRSSMS